MYLNIERTRLDRCYVGLTTLALKLTSCTATLSAFASRRSTGARFNFFISSVQKSVRDGFGTGKFKFLAPSVWKCSYIFGSEKFNLLFSPVGKCIEILATGKFNFLFSFVRKCTDIFGNENAVDSFELLHAQHKCHHFQQVQLSEWGAQQFLSWSTVDQFEFIVVQYW